MALIDEFMAAFGVWEEARPYIHLIVEELEMELIVAMGGQALTVEQVAARLGLPLEQAEALVRRCYSRYIVNKQVEDGLTRYAPADFYARLDHFAKYENWDDLPADVRRLLDRRFRQAFVERHRANVERKMQGLAAENALPNDTILLVHEVEEMIDAATEIIVQPCDCRRLGQNCSRPVETCIWLDDGARAALDRGFGRRLTKAEAKALVRRADQKGLMHTADSEWRTRGLHAICNCCADDCYPFRAALELGSKGVWPRSRYIAAYNRDLCRLCGACVKRCHFGAFYHTDDKIEVNGKLRLDVRFDPDKCWGCGLCANTCTENAITMTPLNGL
jgi:Pyruvate/2-oxoacid:ferredoxin oxidoreductase delta subunit